MQSEYSITSARRCAGAALMDLVCRRRSSSAPSKLSPATVELLICALLYNAVAHLRANMSVSSEASFHRSPLGCSAQLCSRRSRGQPLLERPLTLSRPCAAQEVLDADVLVEIWSVNAFTAPDHSPMPSLVGCRMDEARIPGEGHRNRPPGDQVDRQRVLADGHPLGERRPMFNR